MTVTTHVPDPHDAPDDELAAEQASQSMRSEEAMDAASDGDGFAGESGATTVIPLASRGTSWF